MLGPHDETPPSVAPESACGGKTTDPCSPRGLEISTRPGLRHGGDGTVKVSPEAPSASTSEHTDDVDTGGVGSGEDFTTPCPLTSGRRRKSGRWFCEA